MKIKRRDETDESSLGFVVRGFVVKEKKNHIPKTRCTYIYTRAYIEKKKKKEKENAIPNERSFVTNAPLRNYCHLGPIMNTH